MTVVIGYSAVICREGDLYAASCPEVGTVSRGSSNEEAILNLQEATELYLEEFEPPAAESAFLTTFEVRANA